ncbi:MAG: hypothetical protein AMXMBFR7_11570 [Planctomycetota bacterium]
METYEPFVALAVAVGCGLLIGLQREQAAFAEGGREDQGFLGGVRTHPLYALVGALAMLLARQIGYWLVGAALVAVSVPLVLAYQDDLRKGRDRGLTSEMAFFVSFFCGALAMSQGLAEPFTNRLVLVAAVAIATTALLSTKEPLHGLVKKVTREELYATLIFLVVAAIVLPLAPDEAMGPLGTLNPFHIGLMVVLMSSISFVGYVAIRWMGPGRGLGVTGLVGGLVSSTAVTLSVSGRAKHEPGLASACALAVVLASCVVPLRVLLEVGAVNPSLLRIASLPLAVLLLAGLAGAYVLHRKRVQTPPQATVEDKARLKNPFELGQAVKFGLLFAAVRLACKAAETYLGTSGLLVAGVLGGLTDMDAVTLSMARMAREGTDERLATTCILAAGMSNTVVKGVLAWTLGGGAYGRYVAAASAAVVLAGGLGIAAVWLLF